MGKITYSIVSRGDLKIKYKGKNIMITGELTFIPSVFYADIKSFEKIHWLTDDDRKQIIDFIKGDSFKKIGTEIVFE